MYGGVAAIGAEPPSPGAECWIAITGPVVSFALALLFGVLQPLVAAIAPLLALASYLASINRALALFNLIPGFRLPVLANHQVLGRLSRDSVIGFLPTGGSSAPEQRFPDADRHAR